MGLDGSTCSECLAEQTCRLQPPKQVPRTSAGAQTSVWGTGGLLMCHGAESTREDSWPEEEKMLKGEKTHLCLNYSKKTVPKIVCSSTEANTL